MKWIDALNTPPEENKIVMALIATCSGRMYPSWAMLVNSTRREWVKFGFYEHTTKSPEEVPYDELVLYWQDVGFDGLEAIIDVIKLSAGLSKTKTPVIVVENKETGETHVIGSDSNDMILVNKKGKLQYINLVRNETTGKEGNCKFVESYMKECEL